MLWRELRDRYGEYFEGGMGADAIKALIDRIDFDEEESKLRAAIDPQEGRKPLSAQRKQKAIKRLKIVSAFNRRDEHGRRVNDPRAMILDVVPVIPPELRPMVQLDGGRFATSDLNDLYRRVINRNNRLKRLLDLGAPRSSSTTRSACCRRPSTPCSTTAAAAGRSPARATARSSRSPTCSRASRAGSARTCSASASTTPAVRSSWSARRSSCTSAACRSSWPSSCSSPSS
jgi:DNA-directed RNA polymerase subunit beta'